MGARGHSTSDHTRPNSSAGGFPTSHNSISGFLITAGDAPLNAGVTVVAGGLIIEPEKGAQLHAASIANLIYLPQHFFLHHPIVPHLPPIQHPLFRYSHDDCLLWVVPLGILDHGWRRQLDQPNF